jgi:hypothetical protein
MSGRSLEVLRRICRFVTRKMMKSPRSRGSRVGCESKSYPENAGGTPAATGLLRREGGDDFFEAWIAAERVPPRHQF